ncbi:PAAR-like domain-containing protein [Citrobacter koseri]|uniref:PAAR-like domain-containing protein n=1 Tax=Citrobacter koseri TaxID=545 RepID=UPI003890BD9D|nr:DUF4150 domain-containing protein [Citrobacter koseri]
MADNFTARQNGQWKVVSTKPDVCKTPRGDSTPPVPYPVTANMGAAVMVVSSVKLNGCPAVVLDQSKIPQTIGDTPGAAKGVSSGTVGDVCEPLDHSQTVRFGGKPMLRHNDEFWMNSRNTVGLIVGMPPVAGVSADDADPDDEPETEEEEKEGGGWLDALQTGLDVAGFIPGFGFFADLANAGISAARGNYAEAVMSLAASIPGIGDAAAAGKMLLKGKKAAKAAKLAAEKAAKKKAEMEAAKRARALRKAQKKAAAKKKGGKIKGKNKKNGGKGKGAEGKKCTKPGEPIDAGTGDFLQELSVLNLPGTLPLTLSRFYRSQAKSGGIFGPKWTDDWSVSLTVHDDNLHFTDHEGVVLYYPIPQDGIFHDTVNSRQAHYRLAGDMREELTLFDRRSQQTQIFSPAGHGIYLLSAVHDHYNNRIDFIRTDGVLTEIRHSDGYTLALDWQQQRLMSIDLTTPQKQRLVTCHYDNNGFLVECNTFQFTHLRYEYTAEGFMTRWQDTDKTCVDICYDMRGRVISTLSTEGYYDDRFIYNDEEHCTTYIDAEGGETHYWYNEDGLVTRSLDPLGREETTVWENTQLQSRTDALERTTEYQYNDEGDIRQVSLPGGYSLYYDYNEHGQLTRLTAPGNQVWQWAYDEKGNIVSLTDPQGRQQQFSYNEQGNLLQQIMPGGATWQWNYDTLHQLRETTTPDGGVTQTELDILGRLLSVKDPLGFTTQFRHSKNHAGPEGSVEEINRPDGVRELMRQNSEKLPESFTDGEGKTTRYEYGAFDLLTAIVRPDGERLECRYDKLTRLTEITNAEGGHYRLAYDKAGQLIAETDFTGRTLTYAYDAVGRCIRTTFPDDTHLNRRYNVTDQITDEVVTQGDSERTLSTTTFRYDSLCRLVEAKNDDATVTYEYDDASRITAETLNGRRTEFLWEYERDHITQRFSSGIREYFTFGVMGELAQWQITDHAPLTFEHDLCGQEISRQSKAGFSLRQGYTPTGILTEQQTGDPTELNPHYRRNNTLHRQWLYDKAYNLTMIADSHRGTMVNSLTENDQVSHATWTGSSNIPMREERFSYDKSLNISRCQTWMNEVMESEAHQRQLHGRVTSREYKEWRHSTSRINPDCGMPEEGKFVKVIRDEQTTWKYDINGRLVEKLVDQGGYRPLHWRYRWDSRSQLTGLETPEGERWEYKYDPFGRRISKRCTNRDKPGMYFHWNVDRLTEEIPVNADGTPDDENAIRWIYEPGSFTPLARYEKGQLHYAITDTVGRIQELLTEDGTIVWRGKQQFWGREESANDDNHSCRLRFPGQYEDAESGLYYNRFRYYDCETGQYICADPIELRGGINLYSYAPNPLSWIDPLGLSCKTVKAKSRNDALRQAQQHAQVPRISRGGENIGLDDLNLTSRGNNWGKMKANGGQSLGRRNPNGKNQWFEHPDGHPDAGQAGIPEHHSGGHIHAIDPKGNEVIFTW